MDTSKGSGAQLTDADTTNHFEVFSGLGYARLVPIIPPKAELSPNSSLAKRKDARGKAVGVKGRDNLWRGLDWVNYDADAADLQRWHAMGAGVGIKTGDGLLAIDADTLNHDHARTIRDIVEERFGRLPVRIGRYPKCLYVIRCSEPYRYTRVEFDENERVEVLSDGRQFVAHGIHPVTEEDYAWTRGLFKLADVPTVSAAAIDECLTAIQKALPKAKPIVKEGAANDTGHVNPESLRGDPKHIRTAVDTLPNSNEHFSSREDYLALGYAIKAALPDNEPEAFEIFSQWCERWQDGENNPDTVAADWRRMKPPFRRGAGYIYSLAEALAPHKFSQGQIWFEPVQQDTDELNIFPKPETAQSSTDTYPLLTIGELVSRPPPTWLIARHIPEVSVGFLYSEPGAGKTFLALDIALSIAAGRTDWHGDTIGAPGRPVIYIASEGSFGMRNRILAWLKERNTQAPDTFLMIERTINFMSAEDVTKLMRTLKQQPHGNPALIVVDTVSRALPGADENLQKDMTLFVKACDVVRDAFKCAVLGVHHAGKSGDMRGSTVLRGAGDFVFRLTRKEGATVGQLSCEKQKDGPDGWQEPYRFATVGLDGEQTSLVASRADMSVGPSITMTPDLSATVLAAMQKAWEDGQPWSMAPQAKERFAVRRMVQDHGFAADKAEDILSVWEGSGLIRKEVVSAKTRVSGYRVVRDGGGQTVQNEGIFG
jgi:hypothetical protein